MSFEFRILNDSHWVPDNARLRWQFLVDGKCVFAQTVSAVIREDCSTFQGYFSICTPNVTKRTHGRIEAVLEYDGALHGGDSMELQFFPASSAFKGAVVPIGDGAVSLLQELGAEAAQSGNYLISSYDAYAARKSEVDAAVAKGAKAIFYNLPKGTVAIDGIGVRIEECTMNPRHFAERVPAGSLLDGFEAGDFEHWYDPTKDYIVPLAENCFRNDAFEPVLWTVSDNGDGKWTHAMLAGRKDNWYLTTLKFNGLLQANPTARAFLERLLL